jgi:hypothetical protein
MQLKIFNNKNMYRALIILSFIIVNGFILFGLGQVLLFFNEGAERTQMLNLEPESENYFLPKVEWIKTDNLGRKMEPHNLKKIEKHYLFALISKNQALKTNQIKGLNDFYTQNPLEEIKTLINYNKTNNTTFDATTISHQLSLEFYSDDGKFVVITDKLVHEFQNIYQDKQWLGSIYDTVAYKNILLLEDGFWKIRQSIKINPTDSIIKINDKKALFTVKEKNILKNNKPYLIKGINYYPQQTPWKMFEDAFDEEIIKKDFEIIKNAGLNTIRIFVPFESFGQANIDENKLQRLQKTIELANKYDLAVIITLFDFYGDYSPAAWTITHRHAESLVKALHTNKNILAWDIKNEPDLDFPNREEYNVLPWLKSIINIIKKETNQLVTVGFYNGQQALKLEDEVDFLSYHFYDDIETIETSYNTVNNASKKPVVIQEFGLSSTRTFWNWFGNSLNNQKAHHQKCQIFFKKNDVSFVSWTLYDFDQIPDEVAGKKFWVKHKQKNFGFINTKGKKKPAFEFISY